MTNHRRATGCLLAAALAASAGCGTKLQPAGGRVLVDGNPVTEGTIMFCPVNKGRPATARIMEDGSFTLSFARPGDGLPPGDYRVVIVADIWKEGPKTKAQEYDEANMKRQGIVDTSTQAGGTLIHVVPPIYNDINTTPLTQTVVKSSEPQHFVYDIPYKKKQQTPAVSK
jgi:hypothetical protein